MSKLVEEYKRLGSKLFWKKLFGCDAVFTCAIREKTSRPLYKKGCKRPFFLIPESKEYWYADPLMFENKGKTYLFMEAFSYKKQKGEIVCTEIVDGRCSEIVTVIEEPFHLSFPNVFQFDQKLYMVPEAEASGGINLYRCIEYPYKWERILHIKTEMPVVDCILDHTEGDTCSFLASTFDREIPKLSKYIQFNIKIPKKSMPDQELKNSAIQYLPEYPGFSYENRNAGRFIQITNGTYIHSIQTSTPAIYGYSLKFSKARAISNGWKQDEGDKLEIYPTDLRFIGWKFRKDWIGVHTYDCTEKYEVVDVQYLRWDPLKWFKRALRKIH